MGVSYFEAYMSVSTVSRPHEPSRIPPINHPGEPSPGKVEANVHSSGRSTTTGQRLVPINVPPSAESTRNPSLATGRLGASYVYNLFLPAADEDDVLVNPLEGLAVDMSGSTGYVYLSLATFTAIHRNASSSPCDFEMKETVGDGILLYITSHYVMLSLIHI